MPKRTLRFFLVALSAGGFATEGWADQPENVIHISLQDAVKSAIQRNPSLLAMREEVGRARAEVDVQAGGFVPSLRLNVTGGRRTTLTADPLLADDGRVHDLYGDAGIGVGGRWTFGTSYDVGFSTSVLDSDSNVSFLSPRFESSFGLAIAQPLLRDLGFRANRAPIRAAEHAHEASKSTYASQVEALVAETARRYWRWFVAIAGVKVSKSAQALGEEQLRATQARARGGAISPLEVAQAEATVAQREDDRRAAESIATQAESSLLAVSFLQSAPDFTWKTIFEPIEAAPEQIEEIDLDARVQRAIASRHQVKQLERLVEAQEQLVIAAEDEVWPRLDLVGRVALVGAAGTLQPGASASSDFLAGSWPKTFTNLHRGPVYEVGLLFEYPLDNSGAEAAAVQARRTLAQIRFRLEEQKALVGLEVQKTWRQLQEERMRHAAALEAERLTAINVDAEKKKFAGGISTTFDVLRSQDELTRSRINTARALANLQLAIIAVKLAEGTLLESFGVSTALEEE